MEPACRQFHPAWPRNSASCRPPRSHRPPVPALCSSSRPTGKPGSTAVHDASFPSRAAWPATVTRPATSCRKAGPGYWSMSAPIAEIPRPAPGYGPSSTTAHSIFSVGTDRPTETLESTLRTHPGIRKRRPSSRNCCTCCARWSTRCPPLTAPSANCASARNSPKPRSPYTSGSLSRTSPPVSTALSGCSGNVSTAVSGNTPEQWLPRGARMTARWAVPSQKPIKNL